MRMGLAVRHEDMLKRRNCVSIRNGQKCVVPFFTGRFASGPQHTRMNFPGVRSNAVKRKAFDLVDNRIDIPALFSLHNVGISTTLYRLHKCP
jgi:hypothetical protein